MQRQDDTLDLIPRNSYIELNLLVNLLVWVVSMVVVGPRMC